MKFLSLEKLKLEPSLQNLRVKRKIILKKGEVPHLELVSQVYLKPGNIVSEHTHEQSFELFLVESGTGIVKINGKVQQISKDNFLIIEPGEAHEVLNTGSEDLVITYFEVLNKTTH